MGAASSTRDGVASGAAARPRGGNYGACPPSWRARCEAPHVRAPRPLRVVEGGVLDDGRVEDGPDHVERAPLARAGVEHPHPNPLPAVDVDRVVLVLVRVAVEGDHVRPLGRELLHVGGSARLAEVVLALGDPQLAVDRRQTARADDHHPGHAGADVHEDRLGGAVVHEHAGVLGREGDRLALAGRDVDVVAVGRDLGRVEVDRVRHVDVHRLRAAVDEADRDAVALVDDDRRRGGGARVALAVDGVGPGLGGRERGLDLHVVLVDVDGEALHRSRRHGRQRRIDDVVGLERDALGVRDRRRGRVCRGRVHGGRCRRRGRVAAAAVAAGGDCRDGEAHGEEREEPHQADADRKPVAAVVGGRRRFGDASLSLGLCRDEGHRAVPCACAPLVGAVTVGVTSAASCSRAVRHLTRT
jgi:hypothetical protein